MSKLGVWIGSLAIAVGALCVGTASKANVLTFTWDPSGASPSLAGAGSSITADQISFDTYLYAVHLADTTFTVHQLMPITGLSLHGTPAPAPGLGSTYGLYFDITATGASPSPGVTIYSSVNVLLMADPGNHDGAPHATSGGIAFANTGATGAADDFVLGTGSLVQAALAFNPATMVRNAHYVETYAPAPGQDGFFDGPGYLDLFLTTNPDRFFSFPPAADGTFIQTVNGGFGVGTFVPEPTSLIILASGLAGLALLCRRKRRAVHVHGDA